MLCFLRACVQHVFCGPFVGELTILDPQAPMMRPAYDAVSGFSCQLFNISRSEGTRVRAHQCSFLEPVQRTVLPFPKCVLTSQISKHAFILGRSESHVYCRTNPAKVSGFLNIAGEWDPSLAFVSNGAQPPRFVRTCFDARCCFSRRNHL
jgi:hypothetical protein